MVTNVVINIYSGNSVLSDGTKLITGPMLTLTTTRKHLWYTKQSIIILHQANSSWNSACKMSTSLLSGTETYSIWVKKITYIWALVCQKVSNTGLILGLRPINEKRRYKVTSSLIGWVQTWSQPWTQIAWGVTTCPIVWYQPYHTRRIWPSVINPTSFSLPHNFKVCNRCTESPRRIQC